MTDLVTRFAPSPTGHLHLGHAHSALFGWTAAQRGGGRFLLRIEDIDPNRCRPAFERDLIEDLAWLGLSWGDPGGDPGDAPGGGPVRRQSDHFDDYRAALARLREAGVVYPCFCTRKDIAAEIGRAGAAPHGPDGPLYPGTCRHLSEDIRAARIAAGETWAMRLDVAEAMRRTGPLRWHDRGRGWQTATPEQLGDVVLARKDTPTSYHLSVTLDDHLQRVTLVTRGEDLFFATHTHRLLQALLGFEPPDYHHHGLLRNAAGERLAKRDRAQSLRSLRAEGAEPAAVRALAGFPD
ncbi:tRNA glutamyl-Q(34) synthetase GluQRS [Azospirillum doebereinerae]